MSISFFRTTKNKKFNYKPVYYNEIDERINELKARSKEDYSYDREKLKEKLRSRWGKNRSGSSTKGKIIPMIRLVIILGLTIAIIFYIIKNFFQLL